MTTAPRLKIIGTGTLSEILAANVARWVSALEVAQRQTGAPVVQAASMVVRAIQTAHLPASMASTRRAFGLTVSQLQRGAMVSERGADLDHPIQTLTQALGGLRGTAARAAKAHSRAKCMLCDAPPTKDVRWAEGMGRAWFCDAHFQSWSAEHAGDIDYVHDVKDGMVPSEWSKAMGSLKTAILQAARKARVAKKDSQVQQKAGVKASPDEAFLMQAAGRIPLTNPKPVEIRGLALSLQRRLPSLQVSLGQYTGAQIEEAIGALNHAYTILNAPGTSPADVNIYTQQAHRLLVSAASGRRSPGKAADAAKANEFSDPDRVAWMIIGYSQTLMDYPPPSRPVIVQIANALKNIGRSAPSGFSRYTDDWSRRLMQVAGIPDSDKRSEALDSITSSMGLVTRPMRTQDHWPSGVQTSGKAEGTGKSLDARIVKAAKAYGVAQQKAPAPHFDPGGLGLLMMNLREVSSMCAHGYAEGGRRPAMAQEACRNAHSILRNFDETRDRTWINNINRMVDVAYDGGKDPSAAKESCRRLVSMANQYLRQLNAME